MNKLKSSLVKSTLGAAVTVAVALLCGESEGQAILRLHGSTTVKSSLLDAYAGALETAAGIKLDIVGNGSGKGVQDLIAGRADVAMLSAPLEEVAAKVNAKTPGSISAAGLKEFRIGKAGILFVANPANPVKALSLAQIKDLFSGKIANWKDVGGSDVPVTVVTAIPGDGVRTSMEEKVMGGTAVSTGARAMQLGSQIPMVVAQIPGAIGCVAKAYVSSGVTAIKTDKPVAADLFFVTKGEPSEEARKLIAAAQKTSEAL